MKLRTVLFLVAAVLAALVAITLLLGPRTPAARPLPVPNGYDDFLAAQPAISPAVADWPTLELPALRAAVTSNAPALALVRTGLTRPCLVPPLGSLTNLETRMEKLSGLRRTAQAFAAESRLAALEGHTNAAALAALDCIRFGQESVRGGPLIDSLVGIAIRAIGQAQLGRVMNAADAATLKQIAGTLEAMLATWETAADVTASEERFMRTFPLTQRIGGRIAEWTAGSQSTTRAFQKLDASSQQLARTLLDCAALAWELDHGQRPTSVTNLVPQYLKAIPTDPVTGQPLALPGGR